MPGVMINYVFSKVEVFQDNHKKSLDSKTEICFCNDTHYKKGVIIMDRERKESVVVSVTLKQDMVSKLDEFALKTGIKTNALIREFIDVGLSELSTAKKCDIVEKAFFVMVFLDQHLRFSKEKKGAEGKNQRSITISVRIGKEENEALDKWAIELGKTKNRIIESLIRFRIDELIMAKHVGLLDVSIGLAKLENKIIKIWEKRFKKAQQISNEMFKFEVK